MFQVSETLNVGHRSLRAVFPTFEDACAFVQALEPVCFEVDPDHAGCADAFLASGAIYIVEPFK